MHTANKHGINILGAAILRFSGKTSNGMRESRQIVYVTHVDNKVFLSREACVSLGIISDQFPKVGEIGKRTTTNATSDAPEHLRNDSCLIADCSCPKRELPPPPPTQLHVVQLMVTARRYDNSCWITTKGQPSTHANTNHSR